jgi:hypothetical protein
MASASGPRPFCFPVASVRCIISSSRTNAGRILHPPALLGLFMCFTLRRTGSLAFAIGFHAAFDFANLFAWSGQNAGQYAIGHFLQTEWQGPQWLTGGLLGPEASWMVFPVIGAMFVIFDRLYRRNRFPIAAVESSRG